MTFSRSSLTPVVLIVIAATTAAVLCTLSGAALAQAAHPPEHRLGDHPAVVVQRLQRQAGYDYAAVTRMPRICPASRDAAGRG